METEIVSLKVERIFDLIEIHIMFKHSELKFTARSSSIIPGTVRFTSESGHSLVINNKYKTLDWSGTVFLMVESKDTDVSFKINNVSITVEQWQKLLSVRFVPMSGGKLEGGQTFFTF